MTVACTDLTAIVLSMAKKTKSQVAKAMEVDEYEYRPHLEITEKMYPSIKKLQVDDEVEMKIKVKVKSISRREYGDKKLCVSAVVLDADPKSYEDD